MSIRVTTETKYRAVARYMAMGISLSTICDNLGLSLERWRVVVNEPLFKDILKSANDMMDEKLGEEVATDPIFIKMKMAGKKAVDRVIAEIDNFDVKSGANASSRLKASEDILSRIGYFKKDGPIASANVTIEVSEGKALVINRSVIPSEAPDDVKV